MLLNGWIDAFNEGRLDDVLADVTDDYRFVDPASGPLDAAGHRQLMETVLSTFPDRRIEILRSAAGAGVEFGETRWTGTTPSGEVVTLEGTVVVDVADGRMRGQRWYYQPPANSPLRSAST